MDRAVDGAPRTIDVRTDLDPIEFPGAGFAG
jgi:hypothetical protein